MGATIAHQICDLTPTFVIEPARSTRTRVTRLRKFPGISCMACRLLFLGASAVCLWHDATVLGSQIVGSRGYAIVRGLCAFLTVVLPARAEYG